MVPDNFHDFFVAAAGSSGALVGLLFVAISVSPGRIIGADAQLAHQTRASLALTAFVTPLLLALAALIPGTRLGVVALILDIPALLLAGAALRRVLRARGRERLTARTLTMLVGFAAVQVFGIVYGIRLLMAPDASSALGALCGLLIVSLGIGVDRAWELVGAPSTGVTASLQGLVHPGDKNASDQTRAAKGDD